MAPGNTAHSPNIPYEPLPLSEYPRSSLFGDLMSEPSTPLSDMIEDPAIAPPAATPPPRFLAAALYEGGDIGNRDSVASQGTSGSGARSASAPRFLAAALYEGGDFSNRESVASQGTFGSGVPSAQDSSIYALNPPSLSPPPGQSHDEARDAEQLADVQGTGSPLYLTEKRSAYVAPSIRSKRRYLIAGVAAAALIAIAVAVSVYFTVGKPKSASFASAASPSASSASPPSTSGSPSISGGDGTKITMEDGTTFIYSNPFGGFWYWNPNDPLNNNAQAQSWTPPLNQTFKFGIDQIRGVNLGGWLTTEPFIAPALFEKYQSSSPQAVDEWTLSQAMTADTANGGLSQLETHYKTFITEQDFAEIAGAGLNFIRIPLPYWAIETRTGEPFLPKTAWRYFLKAIQWARKYGLRINLDLHALPGSQNGWNHSGKLGSINVLNGPMGYANAQRSLNYIRIIAEFISQPEYRDVVVMFGITNEPQGSVVGQAALSSYYLQSYNLVRRASGTGTGQGPYVSYHDGFLGLQQWAGFLTGADRIALDDHPYLCFSTQSDAAMSTYAQMPCNAWASGVNTSMSAFGLTTAGEFSNAVTDCGLWVNGVGLGTRYEGTYPGDWPRVGSCTPWTDWRNWDATMKQSMMNFALASMDALQNWFFWTWKIGNSSLSGTVEAPQWSYQLGLQNGWMPKDPRLSSGTCANQNIWSPPLQPWQTGGTGAGQISASASQPYPWPPPTISNAGAVTLLPSYTPTGTVATLPPPTFTVTAGKSTKTADAGDGWNNPSDTAGEMVPIATCSYLDPWIGPSAAPPSPLCSGGAAAAATTTATTSASATTTTAVARRFQE